MKAKYNGYTFKLDETVIRKKVKFHNRYGIDLVGDLYIPKDCTNKMPAIAISGPFGAVKEQASGLYANELAKRGFITLAFDPSFTGESGGSVRNVASPDINTEDFSAAVDFLSLQDNIDENRLLLCLCHKWNSDILDSKEKYFCRLKELYGEEFLAKLVVIYDKYKYSNFN